VPRVSAATPGRSLSTRDTVAMETPAALAISRMVARAFPLSSVVVTASLKQIPVTVSNHCNQPVPIDTEISRKIGIESCKAPLDRIETIW